MPYIKLIFDVSDKDLKEILIAFLSDHGFEGFEEQDDAVCAYIVKDQFSKERLDNSIQNLELFKGVSYQISTVQEENWNSIWESSFKPVVIDEKVGIRASFHEALNTPYELIVDPKMSFGTGHHATTGMMMKLMLNLDFNTKRVFDVGSGSGILSILASMLGANYVLAMDNEAPAYANCCENMGLNQISNIEPLLADDINMVNDQFDIILMNINKNTIMRFADVIGSKLRQSGLLLISGFLQHELDEIATKFTSNGFKKMDVLSDRGWLAASFSKM